MNVGPTLPTTIDGYIYHIISENAHSNSTAILGTKRRRPGAEAAAWDGCNDSASAIDGADSFCKGFMFIPDNQHSGDTLLEECPVHQLLELSCRPGVGFPIIIPYPLLVAACHAVSTGGLIQISQYSLIRYKYDGWGTKVFSTRCTENDNVRMRSGISDLRNNYFVTIELHHDGLRIFPSEIEEDNPGSTCNTMNEGPPLTLEHLAKKETASQSAGDSKISKKTVIRKDPINVTGTVDAISPILFNDSHEEPFAIMELYQPPLDTEGNNVKSAVAVIRGEAALCMHPAIHPGQSITLRGVSRKWKVAEKFQSSNATVNIIPDLHERLRCRVPDRVILVSEAKSILWNEHQKMRGRLDILSLPSTVDSLTSIRGIVKSLHFHRSRSKGGRKVRYTIDFVTMTLLDQSEEPACNDIGNCREVNVEISVDNNPKLARIYLTKYSMSPNLTLGLQPGSVLRAVNIHSIFSPMTHSKFEDTVQIDAHFKCYVACLRSTLAIERCAGEPRLGILAPHPRFVPKGKAFLLVPDHRIKAICSGRFDSRSTEQLSAEDNLLQDLESRTSMKSLAIPLQDSSCSVSVSANLDILLNYHRKISSLGKVNNRRGQESKCSCMKRNCKQTNYENGRLSMRDPYAEFFDHAHNLSFNSVTECGSSCNEFSSFNHFQYCETTSMPRVVELKDLRNACAQNFMNRVAISLHSKSQEEIVFGVGQTQQHSRVTPGWTSCYHFQGLHLRQVLNDYAQMTDLQNKAWNYLSTDSLNEIYVWGTVEGTDSSLFRDKSCVLPICELHSIQSKSEGLHESQLENNGSATWVQIEAVFVSCLCLGFSQNNLEVEISESSQSEGDGYIRLTDRKGYPHRFLPPIRPDCEAVETDGHGFVFLVDNLIFIASVHIAGKPIVSMNENESLKMNNRSSIKHHGVLSVRECLERTCSDAPIEKKVRVVGRLVRQQFRFCRVKPVEGNDGHLKKCFEGWSVVMSHVDPTAEDILDASSALQAIEVRMSVELGESTVTSVNALSIAVRELRKSDDPIQITPDQVSLGTAWWIVSGSSRSVPLLSGGLGIHPSVHLEIPHTSCTFSKLGYQRFRCNLSEINSFFVYEHGSSKGHTSENLHETEFGGNFLPGMLSRRLRRAPSWDGGSSGISRPIFSFLTKLKRHCGVPSVTLAELHWDICSSLKVGDHVHLKPSLLRHIPNAKILGISFCRARVECTKCFQALTGGISCNGSHPLILRERSIGTRTHDNTPKLLLCCPSGCPCYHASVKWECSTTIDDGTGQAKLYAERECALLLLGSFAVAEIEKGAWELEEGVIFQPSLPISSRLSQCLKDVSTTARRKDAIAVMKNVNQNEFLNLCINLLPSDVRAEYLLHQHCRHWYQHNHSRKIDLLCRCKPLSEDVTSVNQTDIQVAKAWTSEAGIDIGIASTATLPPLKLVLEDACHASEENLEDNIAGWHRLHPILRLR